MNDKQIIQEMIYSSTENEVLQMLETINDETILHVYAYNYNWDDGFKIPYAIIDKKCCELSTALMIFYAADGYKYLQTLNEQQKSSDWLNFIETLYIKIINNEYKVGSIKFVPLLNKLQIFKLRNKLPERDQVFLQELGDKNIDINIKLTQELLFDILQNIKIYPNEHIFIRRYKKIEIRMEIY